MGDGNRQGRQKGQNCDNIAAGDDALCRGEARSDVDAEIQQVLTLFESHLKGAYKQYERLRRLQHIRQTQTGASPEEK